MTQQRPRTRGTGERARRWAVALVVPLVVAGGCAGGGRGPAPGADPAKVGPHVSAPREPAAGPGDVSPPPAAASPTPSATSALRGVQDRLAQALGTVDPGAGVSLKLSVHPSAGNQLVAEWTVSRDPDDTTAKTRVRQEAIALLAAAKPYLSSYGSVLLIVDAMVRDAAGNPAGVKAVRAKYSRALVGRTDFTRVSVDTIFKLPDDKPAEIVPAYR